MLKKISFFIFIFCFLVACNKNNNSTSNETKNQESKTTINTEEIKNTTNKEENVSKNQESKEILEERRIYVSAKWLKDFIDKNDKSKYVIAEVTWGEEKDSPDFLKKHIPGAIHINTDSIEEGPVWNLRKADELEKNFLNYGITSNKSLILYGPDIGTDRVAFTALYLGVKDVKILDGRLMAWEKEGYELESGSQKPVPEKDFKEKTPLHPEYILSLEETKEKLENDKDFLLVSIRSKEERLGETSGYSYIPKAGEIKNSVWACSGTGNSGMENFFNEDMTVKNFDEILSLFNQNGYEASDNMAFYCGTGWRAATPWLLMYERGYEAKIFDGGWNEWQMNDDLDVQVGDPNKKVEYMKVKDLSNDKALKK